MILICICNFYVHHFWLISSCDDILSFVFLPCCVCVDLWASAKRGFSRTFCLQLLENQKSIILYLFLCNHLFSYLLSSGLRSHQIKMRKVEQIARFLRMFVQRCVFFCRSEAIIYCSFFFLCSSFSFFPL